LACRIENYCVIHGTGNGSQLQDAGESS
jgi:hypothetical protein